MRADGVGVAGCGEQCQVDDGRDIEDGHDRSGGGLGVELVAGGVGELVAVAGG
mgnify:CR=1 FL=1